LILLQGVAFGLVAWQLGGWGWLLAWPAATSLVIGSAYLANWTGVFGKRLDGRLGATQLLFLAPFFLATWGVWHVQRLLGREDASNEVAPGLWVGRRPYRHELPEGTALVVDMTAEFPVAAAIRREVPFVIVPTLDGTAPSADLEPVLERIEAAQGPVYIHCAAGHGRSATVAAVVAIRRGLAGDVSEAQRLLRAARPGIKLNRAQRERATRASEGSAAA
jgi:protein-tyrosine phosphatase